MKLWNFRKYGSIEDFNINKPNLNVSLKKGLNLLIGENDAGKTAIIDALKLVLKTSSYEWVQLTHDDFYENSERIRIELRFREFKPEEAKNFTEFLSWERYNDKDESILIVIYDVSRRDGRIIPSDLKAGSDGIGKAMPAEMRDYLKVTYLKPLRDAKTELTPKKNSRLSQIFQEHEAFKNNKEHLLLSIYEKFNVAIKSYFEGKDIDGNILIDDQNGKELKNSIDASIKGFFTDKNEVSINTTHAEIKKILESLELTLSDLLNPGLGSLNRLFIASELVHLNKNNWTGLRLGLIEEIEAHLHPQIQLKVINSIQNLEETQLIVTTHSPNLASKVPLDKLIVCRNNAAYSLDPEFTCLEKSNYIFLEKFLDVTKSNLFFAKGLILVEGWAEEILVPIIAKKIGLDLVKHEISIINVGNLGFSHYYKIFSRKDGLGMDIPISVITDCDERAYDEVIENSKKEYRKRDITEYRRECDIRTTKVIKGFSEPAKPFVSYEWTFEWCLYKSAILGSKFIEIMKLIHSGTEWDNEELKLAEKLINKSLNKTEISYKLAKNLENDDLVISLEELEKDVYIKYIIEAIQNVCK